MATVHTDLITAGPPDGGEQRNGTAVAVTHQVGGAVAGLPEQVEEIPRGLLEVIRAERGVPRRLTEAATVVDDGPPSVPDRVLGSVSQCP